MAIPNFFDKAARAAAHVIHGLSPQAFAEHLNAHVVGVCFDEAACRNREARVLLEMLVDLLSRLYPRLALRGAGARSDEMLSALKAQARAINPAIEFAPASARCSVCVVVGDSKPGVRCATMYAGSNGWMASFSSRQPVSLGTTDNPIGAAAAACFAAANVFRILFEDSLPNARMDADFSVSLLNLQRGPQADNPALGPVHLGETHLVGLGAIGSATAWALSKMKLTGTLHLIDPEHVDLSNLQRYTSTTQSDVGVSKVDRAAALLRGTGAMVVTHAQRWDEYLRDRGNYHLDRVAVALDNVPDRLLVQGSLPRRVLNAWTQPGDLGVSRHSFLGEDACLACLYLPTGKELDFDELVARAIGLLPARMQVRHLLYTNEPVGRELLQSIADANKVALEQLLPFEGRPLRAFYQEGICGGMILPAAAHVEGIRGAEVPMAFQSALAGVLLAAEMVADAGALRKTPLPVATRINLLAPLASFLVFPERKRPGERCICQDKDYIGAYEKKYPKATGKPRTPLRQPARRTARSQRRGRARSAGKQK